MTTASIFLFKQSQIRTFVGEPDDPAAMARQMHPGQRNSLDALCRRYGVDNTKRALHGALLDAEILAEVYLAMTGGQVGLQLDSSGSTQGSDGQSTSTTAIRRLPSSRGRLPVIQASEEEQDAHQQRIKQIDQVSGGAIWSRLLD